MIKGFYFRVHKISNITHRRIVIVSSCGDSVLVAVRSPHCIVAGSFCFVVSCWARENAAVVPIRYVPATCVAVVIVMKTTDRTRGVVLE